MELNTTQPIEPHEFRKRHPFVAHAVLALFVLSLGLFFANLRFHFFDKQEVMQEKSEQQEQSLAPSIPVELASFIASEVPSDNITVISGDSAVFVMPTDAQMEQMQKEMGDDFETTADDISYYTGEAWSYLTDKGVSVMSAKTRYLSFIVDGTTFYIDTEKMPPDFGNLILFHDGAMPHIALPIDIKQEYVLYYRSGIVEQKDGYDGVSQREYKANGLSFLYSADADMEDSIIPNGVYITLKLGDKTNTLRFYYSADALPSNYRPSFYTGTTVVGGKTFSYGDVQTESGMQRSYEYRKNGRVLVIQNDSIISLDSIEINN